MTQETTSLFRTDALDPAPQRLGSKVVFLSRPYRPETVAPLVGRESEMKLITAAWLAGPGRLPLSPLLLGEPGVGKNRVVYELAAATGRDLYIFQGHEDVTAEDLACAVRFSDDKSRKMDYVVSPLVTAMLNGGICFIDEIAKIRPRALALLVSVLDERRYIDSTLLGERISARPGFRFIAATNTADLEGNALPEFLRSRLRPVIDVGFPPRAEIDRMIRDRHGRFGEQLEPLLEAFWRLWREKGGGRSPTPRDVIYLFDLAASLADYDRLDRAAANRLESGNAATIVPISALETAFAELFRLNPSAPR